MTQFNSQFGTGGDCHSFFSLPCSKTIKTMENPEIPYETKNLKFTLERFNPRRKARGADCVKMKVTYDTGVVETLWMSKDDLLSNLDEFGYHAALNEGLKHYT